MLLLDTQSSVKKNAFAVCQAKGDGGEGDEIRRQVTGFSGESSGGKECQQNQYLEKKAKDPGRHLEDLCQDYSEKTGK